MVKLSIMKKYIVPSIAASVISPVSVLMSSGESGKTVTTNLNNVYYQGGSGDASGAF